MHFALIWREKHIKSDFFSDNLEFWQFFSYVSRCGRIATLDTVHHKAMSHMAL
jgi:hypothetical protein